MPPRPANRRFPSGMNALDYPEYRTFWWASAVSNSGGMMHLAAIGWVVELLTDDALKVTIAASVGLLPLLLLSPLAGSIADRFSRRQVILFSVIAQLFVSVVWAVLYSATDVSFAVILMFSVLGGVAGALGNPVQLVIVPELVPLSHTRNAVSLVSVQWNIARAVGPLVGGLLIQISGPGLVFWVNAISYFALVFAMLRIQRRPAAGSKDVEGTWSSIRSGVRYMRSVRGLVVGMTAGLCMAVVMVPSQWMAVLIARDAFDADAWQFGVLAGAFGVGSILGAVFVLPLQQRYLASQFVLVGMIVMSVAVIGVAASPSYWLGVAATTISGVGFIATISNLMSSLQQLSSDEFRGRVMSLWMTLFGLVSPIAVLLLGVIAQEIHIRWAVAASGAVGLVAVAVIGGRRLFPLLDLPLDE